MNSWKTSLSGAKSYATQTAPSRYHEGLFKECFAAQRQRGMSSALLLSYREQSQQVTSIYPWCLLQRGLCFLHSSNLSAPK